MAGQLIKSNELTATNYESFVEVSPATPTVRVVSIDRWLFERTDIASPFLRRAAVQSAIVRQHQGTVCRSGRGRRGGREGANHAEDQPPKPDVLSGDNGQFSFSDLAPGPFQLTVSAPGFETKLVSGIVNPGQAFIVPAIVLTVAAATTNVNVGLSQAEVAQEEVKEQEKQRVLGIFPNFYTTYVPIRRLWPRSRSSRWPGNRLPIPSALSASRFLAGIYQASDRVRRIRARCGSYGRRFDSTLRRRFFGTFIDSAILPSAPENKIHAVFLRGNRHKTSQSLCAANAIISGDNQQWQLNYSTIVGSFATAGLSYTYYPASDRGGTLLVETALIRIAEGSVAGLFQEFVIPHLTPRLKSHPAPPQQP